MRTLLLATFFISITIIGSIFVYNYIENTAIEFSNNIEEIETLINEDRWDDAYEKFDQFNKKWEPNSKIWMSVISHEEIDNIEQALTESDKYIINRHKEALVELSLLRYYLKHIYLKEQINLQNIF